MGTSGRHDYFERLMAMRSGYPAADDRGAALSIDDAIRYAEAIMTAVELDAEPWVAELDRAVPEAPAEVPDHPGHVRRFASDLLPRPLDRSRPPQV
jgi:hypothetical protein